MSHCTVDLRSDFLAMNRFVVENPGLMLAYVLAQILSQLALSKATIASSLNLAQRLTLTIVLTCLIFAAKTIITGNG